MISPFFLYKLKVRSISCSFSLCYDLFEAGASDGKEIWIYSLTYTCSYVIPSFVLSIIVSMILLSTRPKPISTKK
ncbi:energy-coupled thiamine transporter ThiT [Niallia taxi]|uniref:energy-coupled thiamine transporter ThiT n=1 Tax=Niallia taxi TaxID=2499688 RepID=UPI003D8179CE